MMVSIPSFANGIIGGDKIGYNQRKNLNYLSKVAEGQLAEA